MSADLRFCLRDPIPEIFEAARMLAEAVDAHLAGRGKAAADLIRRSDMPEIREWTESLWGSNSPYVTVRPVDPPVPLLEKKDRIPVRMPGRAEKVRLHERDGYHCRFCGIPVIRVEIRRAIRGIYPDALPWGSTNNTQHAAFQAMWVQYDHLLPHSRGGNNDFGNLIITCAPCNYSRMHYTLGEVGLANPLDRDPVKSSWDGLERFR